MTSTILLSKKATLALFMVVALLLSSSKCDILPTEEEMKDANYRTLSDKEFFEATHVKNKDGYLAFFGAAWCGHCTHFKPIFNEYSKKALERQLPINPECIFYPSDSSDTITTMFRINAFPTIAYIRDGRWCRFSGNRDEQNLNNFIKKSIDEKMHGENCHAYQESYPSTIEQLMNTVVEAFRQINDEYWYYMRTHKTATMAVTAVMVFCLLIIFIGAFLFIKDLFFPVNKVQHHIRRPNPEDESKAGKRTTPGERAASQREASSRAKEHHEAQGEESEKLHEKHQKGSRKQSHEEKKDK